MNYTALLLLLAAGMLLLSGCAGKSGYAAKEGQEPTQTGNQAQEQAGAGSASGLTENDLALFENADSVPELSDLPMDDG